MRRAFVGAVVACSALLATPSRADGPAATDAQMDRNKQLATDLFDEGVRDLASGNCDKTPVGNPAVCESACKAFKRAQQLYPEGLGALRNLAYIELHLNLVASAARDFRDLIRAAQHDPRPERHLWADFAATELAKIEGRIPRLTVHVLGTAQMIALDQSPLPQAAWETKLDLDPGTHHLHAESPDAEPFDSDVVLAEGREETVTIALKPRSGLGPATAGATASTDEPRRSRTLPVVVGVAGLAVAAVGLGFGAAAWSERGSACGDSHVCDPSGLSTGRSYAQLSTVLTAAGGAVFLGGAIWYLLTPSGDGKAGTALRTTLAPAISWNSVSLSLQGPL